MNKRSSDPIDSQFLLQSGKSLERSVERIDSASLSRLNRIRHTALAAGNKPAWPWWIPASGLATASVLVIAVTFSLDEAKLSTPSASPLGDLELLASNEDLEMLAELEFYAWLETELEG